MHRCVGVLVCVRAVAYTLCTRPRTPTHTRTRGQQPTYAAVLAMLSLS